MLHIGHNCLVRNKKNKMNEYFQVDNNKDIFLNKSVFQIS